MEIKDTFIGKRSFHIKEEFEVCAGTGKEGIQNQIENDHLNTSSTEEEEIMDCSSYFLLPELNWIPNSLERSFICSFKTYRTLIEHVIYL